MNVQVQPIADLNRIRTRILLLTLALVIAAATLLSVRTHQLFEAALTPEIMQKTDAVAELATLDVEQALNLGIPLEKLVGVVAYFDEVRASHPEIQFAGILNPQGRPLFMSGDGMQETATALSDEVSAFALGSIDHDIVRDGDYDVMLSRADPGGVTAAVVAIGLDPRYIHRQLEELTADVFIVLLVALFLAFEMAVVLLTGRTITPLNQLISAVEAGAQGKLHRLIAYHANDGIGRVIARFNAIVQGLNDRYRRLVDGAGQRPALRDRVTALGARLGLIDGPLESYGITASINDVRLPLFVFVMAEELQKPFLPLYIRSLEVHDTWLSPQVLIGVPISVYMLTLALATPIAGSWADQYGPRRIFLAGLVVAIGGFLGAALAGSLLQLVGARALGAVGYGMCTIAAQGFIVQVTTRSDRTQGISVFVTVLMSASICGTAIGGILVDRIGYRAVFVCAAALCLIAGVLALRMMAKTETPEPAAPRFRLGDLGIALRNPRFLALVMFAAIPNKIVLTGFLFYAVPLYLAGINISEADTGRVMILYSLVIVFVGPWVSRLNDQRGYGWSLVFAGTLLSGLAMFLLWFRADIYGVSAAVLAVAFAHALSISPQIALVPEICGRDIEEVGQTMVLGALRMLERVGSVIGPLLVAGLAYCFGYIAALMTMGGMIAITAPLLLLARWNTRSQQVPT